MELREIKKIIELMKQNELTEFELQEEDFRIAIKRGNGLDHPMVVTSSPVSPVMMPAAPVVAPAAGSVSAEPPAAESGDEDEGQMEIRSPIVGTFFRANSPEVDPFVSVGQEVEEDTVVCIIEAMKVMNEIKAEVRGIIRKALVENATPVEYGQPLFMVEPL